MKINLSLDQSVAVLTGLALNIANMYSSLVGLFQHTDVIHAVVLL